MTEASPKLLNVEQAAHALGVSQSMLNKGRVSGSGPKFIRIGSRCLYDPRDLTAWIDERRRSSTSDRGASR